ncbi:hypothetical protein BGZ97_003904 [Linnemannia gamsii]|uniref:Major facilitator superfamily (MFS) profile domain-containing protein n=1 Tax=Linnemannia gamsii TaxID=64522 RepID=A0A9P6UG72_9FUNG|nr:hypothetical protein BGZ97_003904 [Linnemannia gamsii]
MSDSTAMPSKQSTPLPPSSALVHLDSELTITSADNKKNDLGKEEYYSADKNEVDVEYASATAMQDDQPVLVDGPLFGWVVVFASFTSQMISMGVCNVYGVYQNYYFTEKFQGEATTFQLAWIGSLAIMALDLAGPFTGSICDYFGHRQSAIVGVIIMTLSLAAAAFATQVWQLYLTQGVLYGLGGSLTYFASLTLPSQWFTKQRGLVTGIAISGGGIGGLWISPIVSKLLSNKGFKFTMLTMAIAHFVLLVPACMFYKTRRETGRQRAKRIKQFGCRKGESLENEKKRKFIDWTIMKDIRFSLLFVAGIFVVSGYFTPFYFINSYAIQHGVDKSTAALMIGLMNAASAVGRIVMGLVSDKIGSMNALCISTFAATLTLLLLWTFAKTVAVMFVFSIAYGLCCGAYLSSTVSVSAAIAGLDRLGSVTGILYAGMAIGSTIGSPTSGAILDTIGHGTDYMGVIVWSGTVMLIGSLIQFGMKFATNRNIFAKV